MSAGTGLVGCFGSTVTAFGGCAACVSCDCGALAAEALTGVEDGEAAAWAGTSGVCDCAATNGLPSTSTPNASVSARMSLFLCDRGRHADGIREHHAACAQLVVGAHHLECAFSDRPPKNLTASHGVVDDLFDVCEDRPA